MTLRTITVPVDDVIGLRPEDIREEFAGTHEYDRAVWDLSDDELRQVADYVKQDADLWEVIHRLLVAGLSELHGIEAE